MCQRECPSTKSMLFNKFGYTKEVFFMQSVTIATCVLSWLQQLFQTPVFFAWLRYVTVHEQIGRNAQKRENRVFLQHHSSGTTMSSELILDMAVTEDSLID